MFVARRSQGQSIIGMFPSLEFGLFIATIRQVVERGRCLRDTHLDTTCMPKFSVRKDGMEEGAMKLIGDVEGRARNKLQPSEIDNVDKAFLGPFQWPWYPRDLP